jgi:uncharacterized protein (TIGR02145 family)
MKHIFTLSICFLALSLSAQETITYPYNPDGDVDGAIALPDLLDLLGVYSNAFTPTEIQIDGVGLLQVIQDLQNQINNNALPDGIFSGDILIWNGTAWMPEPPPVDDCGVYGGDGSSCALTPITDDNIQAAVDVWISHEDVAEATYGHISEWDVSSVTNMWNLFASAYDFNGDISSWDVSSVTDMFMMFNNAWSFNGDISAWDVSSVMSMSNIFQSASSFNGDISSWDVSSVMYMNGMFSGASSFNGDISSWDVSSVSEMSYMFSYANSFNSDISSWDVSSVTYMGGMFKYAYSFNGDLSSWDVSSVTNMSSMFKYTSSFNGDLSSWDVSSVTNMSYMFDGASDLSEENKCLIHTSFSSNSVWTYDWSEFCAAGCDGILYSGLVNDECGVCDGDNSTCLDECGVPNGDNSTCLDECGVPNGDNSTCCGDSIAHEGYDYYIVQIGGLCWFAENCRYLPSVSPSSEGSPTEPYYYVYGYEGTDVATAQDTTTYDTYGVLYNWPAVMTEGICPSGWHIPSDGEFTELTDFLGGEGVAGGKMKEAGYDHWNSPNTGATNSSGWTGLPGGYRASGGFYSDGYYGDWWSASEAGSGSWTRLLSNYNGSVNRGTSFRDYGFSARCVRD